MRQARPRPRRCGHQPAAAGPAGLGGTPSFDDTEFTPVSGLLASDYCTLEEHGAACRPLAALPALNDLERTLATCPAARAGTRLHDIAGLADLLAADTPIGTLATRHLGPAARPVRAILFDKTPGTNWALGWHQDRTAAVRDRHDVPGYGPWSIKAGIQHVEPPFEIIQGMVTLRIHLDDVPADNAPLLIAPGSHRLGRVAEPDIAATVERCGTAMCLAARGDVWTYATSILHASAAASPRHAHRRVLQVDYASVPLQRPLTWLGV